MEIVDDQRQVFLAKLGKTGFKIWKEESYFEEDSHTVMHIESVFDIMELIKEWAAINQNIETLVFADQLKKDIEKAIGREEE